MFVCTRGCIVSLLGEGGGGLKSTGMTLVIAEKHCARVCIMYHNVPRRCSPFIGNTFPHCVCPSSGR